MKMTKCLSLVLCAVACASANDIDTLFARMKSLYVSDVSVDTVQSILKSQHSDGTWDGLKYNTKNHMPIGHLEKTRVMSQGYDRYCSTGKKPEGIPCSELEGKITKALTFWFDHKKNFVSDNWWMNEIGAQIEFSPIYFLMWDKLSDSLKKSVLEYYPEKPSREGTNRIWISENVIVRGIWERRDELIKLGIENMENTILVTHREGNQADYSFYMHGNQLYNGGYGRSALYTAAQWAAFARGTKFAYGAKSLRDMSFLALYGNRWMMWKGMADAMTMGREVSLDCKNKSSEGYVEIIDNLKLADPAHRADYDEWLRDIKGDEHLNGCHYYWRGEMMVCKSRSYYTSLKMSSTRVVGSEFLNRENRRGFWLGMGVLSVYLHPDDFKNIYPLWDWTKLPGVTSYAESEMKDKRVSSQTNFTSGIDEDKFGVASMILKRPSLDAKKTWFFLDGTFVALGSDISSDHSSAITTSLDQRHFHGNAATDKGAVEENKPVKARALWHDGLGYKTLDDQEFNVLVKKEKGYWNNIGTSKGEERGILLTLWQDHGVKPQNAHYAYSVSLQKNKAAFFKNKKDPISVLRNDNHVQAIFDSQRKILMGTFYEKDSVNVKSLTMSFDGPATFMLKRNGDECLLKIVDPLQHTRTISVDMKYVDKAKRVVSYDTSLQFIDDNFIGPMRQVRMACPTGF